MTRARTCQVVASDDGVCWSLTDAGNPEPATSPAAAFRRAACFARPEARGVRGVVASRAHPAEKTASAGLGPQLPERALLSIAAKQIVRARLSPDRTTPSGTVTFLDRRTLRTSTHHVTVHPYDGPARQRTPDEFRLDQKELSGAAPLDQEEWTRRWQRLSDERFGAFAELDQANVRQLPLKVALARLSDPCGLRPAPLTVAGVGADRPSARERLIAQTLAVYASIVVDPRLLVDRTGAFLGPPDIDASRLLETVCDRSADAFVRATDLTDGRERLLPARQVFPALRSPGPAAAPCGTSAAPGWQQAVAHGLLQQCARLTVSDPALRSRRPATLAAEDFAGDPAVRYLAAMVKAAGLDLTLRDITGPAQVPVVACASPGQPALYGAGEHRVQAVAEALTGALFHYQLRRDPALKAAVGAAAPPIWTNPADPAATGSPDRLAHALAGLGYPPSVVILDHDQAVHQAIPNLLRVVVPSVSRIGERM